MPTKLDELKELRAKQFERANRALRFRERWHTQLRKAGVPQSALDFLFSCERVAAFVGASTQARNENERTDEISKCVDVFCAKKAATEGIIDENAMLPLTPNEQAIFDLLTGEGQPARDIRAALLREGIRTIDEAAISRACKSPAMKSRGVGNRRGAGYFKIEPTS